MPRSPCSQRDGQRPRERHGEHSARRARGRRRPRRRATARAFADTPRRSSKGRSTSSSSATASTAPRRTTSSLESGCGGFTARRRGPAARRRRDSTRRTRCDTRSTPQGSRPRPPRRAQKPRTHFAARRASPRFKHRFTVGRRAAEQHMEQRLPPESTRGQWMADGTVRANGWRRGRGGRGPRALRALPVQWVAAGAWRPGPLGAHAMPMPGASSRSRSTRTSSQPIDTAQTS